MPAAESAAPAKRKLSYKDQRELEQLPARIEQLENAVAELGAAMNEAAFFQQAPTAIVAANQRLATVQAELEQAYARWSELEG